MLRKNFVIGVLTLVEKSLGRGFVGRRLKEATEEVTEEQKALVDAYLKDQKKKEEVVKATAEVEAEAKAKAEDEAREREKYLEALPEAEKAAAKKAADAALRDQVPRGEAATEIEATASDLDAAVTDSTAVSSADDRRYLEKALKDAWEDKGSADEKYSDVEKDFEEQKEKNALAEIQNDKDEAIRAGNKVESEREKAIYGPGNVEAEEAAKNALAEVEVANQQLWGVVHTHAEQVKGHVEAARDNQETAFNAGEEDVAAAAAEAEGAVAEATKDAKQEITKATSNLRIVTGASLNVFKATGELNGFCGILKILQDGRTKNAEASADAHFKDAEAHRSASLNADKTGRTGAHETAKEYTISDPENFEGCYKISNWVGCYKDDAARNLDYRGLEGRFHTTETCNAACNTYKYFGLQNSGECWCGDQVGNPPENPNGPYKKVDDSECGEERDGRGWKNAVYATRDSSAGGVKGELGTLGCPVGSSQITSAQACQDAAAALGITYHSTDSWSGIPPGCIYHSGLYDWEVTVERRAFFNSSTVDPFSTGSHPRIGAICNRPIPGTCTLVFPSCTLPVEQGNQCNSKSLCERECRRLTHLAAQAGLPPNLPLKKPLYTNYTLVDGGACSCCTRAQAQAIKEQLTKVDDAKCDKDGLKDDIDRHGYFAGSSENAFLYELPKSKAEA